MNQSTRLIQSFAATAIVLASAATWVASAYALEPDKLFEKVSPSVVTVVAMQDPTSKEFQSGSGIVIDPDTVITNCHVLQGGKVVVVKIGKRILPAKLQFPDVERDLCQLSVADLQAPAIQFSSTSTLRVGQRVYAVGNPRQLELTLSDGLISSLRDSKDGAPIVQTTAPISPGSSGGGLFDTEGRLIGITTFQRRDSQNLNFALPVDWIRDVPARGRENLAKYKAGAPVSGPAPIAPAPAPAPYQPRIAAIAPPAAPPNPEWGERVALLEKNGAQTLTQALSVLLDVTDANEVNLIQRHENFTRRKPWSNAYALGIDQEGRLIWGGAYSWNRADGARDTALQYCMRAKSDRCSAVMINGDFKRGEFLTFAKSLTTQSVAELRRAYLQGIAAYPTELVAGRSGSQTGQNAYGFTSSRE